MEDNTLIAEFMGMELGDDKTVYYDDAENLHPPTPVNELQFHTSWDWLMPVVYKILWLKGYEDESYEDIHNGLTNALLTQTYDAVVEFIKQYKQ
jgi:hypothetical protein|tara:strand:- start:648 stop:929 length:282 start_codon:yes stop_codon:yes gene_type:complete